MLNKNFEKGITILEALVATAILGMIAMFFINSSSVFLGSQQTLVKQNKYQQLADLIIKDVSEHVKSEFNPYGEVVVDQTITEGNKVFLRGIDEVPKIGDIFLVQDVGEQFKIVGDSKEWSGATDGNPEKIYEIIVEGGITKGRNEIAIDKNVTFIYFQKNELTCFKDIIDLKLDDPSTLKHEGVDCEQDIKNLVTEWQNRIKADTKIDYATIEMSNEGLLTVTLGDEINNTVIAKKFPQCAFNINISETEEDAGSVVFDFGGNIGAVETGIMIGNENPTHHYFLNNKNHKQYTDGSTLEVYSGNSCASTISSSPCRQNYAYLNTITVFLYQYDGTGSTGSTESATTPSYEGDVWLQASLCKNTFKMPNGETWKQCDKIGADNPDYEKVETNELSLWFIFSEAAGKKSEGRNGGRTSQNGHGYLGFRTSGLPVGARVLVFDDASESCYESIEQDAGTKYKCDGGYDWNGKHDGLVLHLDKKVEDINLLEDVFLSLTSPSYNIKEWKVLKSSKNDEDDTWTPGCLLAENVIGSAFDGGRDDSCWQTIESTFSTLKETISDTKYDELIIEPPYEDFKPENGFLRIGSELIAYDTYDADSGKFKGLVRGLFNKVKVMDDDVDGFKNKGIQVGCVDKKKVDDSSEAYNFITMETAYPVQKYREKLSLYNDLKYKELVDLRLTNVCESDKLSGGGKQYSSPNMEMGRWYSWAHNETKGQTYTLIQRVKNNFVVTRDHQYDGGGKFSKGDIIYNELSEPASHSKGDRVYDGYPDINAPGIYLDNDDDDKKKFPNEMSKYTGIEDKEQLVISVPRKVQLRTSTAKPPSSIMTCI